MKYILIFVVMILFCSCTEQYRIKQLAKDIVNEDIPRRYGKTKIRFNVRHISVEGITNETIAKDSLDAIRVMLSHLWNERSDEYLQRSEYDSLDLLISHYDTLEGQWENQINRNDKEDVNILLCTVYVEVNRKWIPRETVYYHLYYDLTTNKWIKYETF